MNIEAALFDLEEQLIRAESDRDRAQDEWYSCTLNTPGRCTREADKLAKAMNRVAAIKVKIGQLEREAVEP